MAKNLTQKKQLKKALLITAAALLCAVLWFVASVFESAGAITGTEPPLSIDEAGETGAYNMLLIGTDSSDKLTDTIMVVRADFENNNIKIVSLLRDTRVKLGSGYSKLNAVYGRDGLDGLISCVKEMTGVPVHYYAMVDLDGFKAVVDLLGGVEFDVPQDMKYSDPYQDLYIDLKKGRQLLDGEQSMQLVRFRRYADGDVQRTKVQKDFIKAIIEQKLTPAYLLKLSSLFKTLSQYAQTNATLSDVISKSTALSTLAKDDEIEVFEFPGVAGYVGQLSYFLYNQKATYELFEEHFGGTGQPEKLLYTDYSNAAPMNPGGGPLKPAPNPDPPTQTVDNQTEVVEGGSETDAGDGAAPDGGGFGMNGENGGSQGDGQSDESNGDSSLEEGQKTGVQEIRGNKRTCRAAGDSVGVKRF